MLNAAWVSHPGSYIKEELEARDWSQRDLAYILGCPEQAINLIVTGKRGISPEMAKALGEAFDVPAEFFLDLQKAYDLSRAREPDPGVSSRARLQKAYPVREMIKRGWLEDSDAGMLEAQMAKFFEVSRTEDVPYLAHAAKKSSYEEKEIPAAQLAWLFRVKQIAKSITVPQYSDRALRHALPQLKHLLFAAEESRNVPRILMECGVRLILVEALPHAKIDGVCFWLNENSPVIGMSLRYDRIDNFWFVLRHEIEHVLQQDHYAEIIDAELEGERAAVSDSLPKAERIANAAAADFCVSADEIVSFIARKQPFFAERDILAFARRIQVHPGLIVGQIQARTKKYDLLRRYLVKVRQFVLPGAIVDGWGQVAPVSL
jgi:HTH-type transcriptional regulator/antitoxin HigA